VNNNSTSAPTCIVDASGNVVSGQGGCYNTLPSVCTDSVLPLIDVGNGISSFKFFGSAVYINTLLDRTSPLYNVTLDGTTKSIDGFREVGPSLCTTLVSQEGLDERTEHEISVLVVGFSPSLNETMQNEYGTFSEALLLNNIMVTTSNSGGNISVAPSQSNGAYSVSAIPFVLLSLLPVYSASSILLLGMHC